MADDTRDEDKSYLKAANPTEKPKNSTNSVVLGKDGKPYVFFPYSYTLTKIPSKPFKMSCMQL